MRYKITGFRQDAQDDWVADLECDDTQHMRRHPPGTSRAHYLGQPDQCQQDDEVHQPQP